MAIKTYGLLGARFPHLNALVGVQSIACFLWAGLLLLVFPSARQKGMAPIASYWLPGLTNTAGPALGFQALKNISYPAQVLPSASFSKPTMFRLCMRSASTSLRVIPTSMLVEWYEQKLVSQLTADWCMISRQCSGKQ